MSEFDDLMGLPDGVPAEIPAESQYQYYKVPQGLYDIVFGKLNYKYKDLNNKPCDAGVPGAQFRNMAISPLWLLQYDGTAQIPNKKVILGKNLTIPANPVAELYYPHIISWEPKRQWINIKLFENFEIKGISQSKVVTLNPAKPTGKIMNFGALKYFYGSIATINIIWTGENDKYVNIDDKYGIKLTGERIPLEKMKQFEVEIDAKLQLERASRAEAKSNSYTPPTEDDSELSDFIGDSSETDNDLPF